MVLEYVGNQVVIILNVTTVTMYNNLSTQYDCNIWACVLFDETIHIDGYFRNKHLI